MENKRFSEEERNLFLDSFNYRIGMLGSSPEMSFSHYSFCGNIWSPSEFKFLIARKGRDITFYANQICFDKYADDPIPLMERAGLERPDILGGGMMLLKGPTLDIDKGTVLLCGSLYNIPPFPVFRQFESPLINTLNSPGFVDCQRQRIEHIDQQGADGFEVLRDHFSKQDLFPNYFGEVKRIGETR